MGRDTGSDAMARIERHEDWCERREQMWTQRWKDSDVAAEAARVRIYERMDANAARADERMERIAKEQRSSIGRLIGWIIAGFGALVSAMAGLIVILLHGGAHL